MIKAVVFDMDGLLVDSEPLWQEARTGAFPGQFNWTDADQQQVMGSSTRGWATYMEGLLGHRYGVDEIIEMVLDQMERLYRANVPLLPGAREVLDSLAGRYPLGLATGSPHRLIKAATESAGWTRTFNEIVSSDELTRGKPAPDIYLEIARRMNVPTENIAIFEDSANGILAGYTAGANVIAVPSNYLSPPPDVLNRVALVIPSLQDFKPEMLDTL